MRKAALASCHPWVPRCRSEQGQGQERFLALLLAPVNVLRGQGESQEPGSLRDSTQSTHLIPSGLFILSWVLLGCFALAEGQGEAWARPAHPPGAVPWGSSSPCLCCQNSVRIYPSPGHRRRIHLPLHHQGSQLGCCQGEGASRLSWCGILVTRVDGLVCLRSCQALTPPILGEPCKPPGIRGRVRCSGWSSVC